MVGELLGAGAGGNMGLAAMMFVAFIVIYGAIWIYTSLAFMFIGKKAKVSTPGLAWIPGLGPILVAFMATGKKNMKPWWYLLSGIVLSIIGMILFVAGTFSQISFILGIILLIGAVGCVVYFSVMSYIWLWHTYVKVKSPGWWAIIPLFSIPFELLAFIPGLSLIAMVNFIIAIWNFIVIGIVAWRK